jgi:hypothetical protein
MTNEVRPVVRSELRHRNLRSLPSGPTRMRPWMRRPRSATNEAKRHDALNGVALSVRNSQLDKSASVRVAELLTVTASSTSRRNVLGAIALKRSIATSRGDDNRDERETNNCSAVHEINFETSKSPPALPLRNDPDGDRSRLTDSFRNGLIQPKLDVTTTQPASDRHAESSFACQWTSSWARL